MSIEEMYNLSEKMAGLTEKLDAQMNSYSELINETAELERELAKNVLVYLDTAETKKTSWEKLEVLAVAKSEEAKEKYLKLVWLRHKRKLAEKLLDATQSALSSCQSMIKYVRPDRNYNDRTQS